MKKIFFLLILVIFLVSITNVFALSNESIQAEELVAQAKQDILEMELRNISIIRANESLQESIQLYSAQLALEETGKKANYNLVIEYALKVSEIKKIAFKSEDELKIFLETYEKSEKEANLSEMSEEYSNIINSFKEERFEDTIGLINKGYDKLSEVQSSQTTLRLFYSTTSKTLKKFFVDNWLKLIIGGIIIILFLLIFWKAISKIRIKMKFNNLVLQKNTLKELIKRLQYNYFKKGIVSEREYSTKLSKFEELIRDIDRQIPLLKEEMIKLNKEGSYKTYKQESKKDVLKPIEIKKVEKPEKNKIKIKEKISKSKKISVKKIRKKSKKTKKKK